MELGCENIHSWRFMCLLLCTTFVSSQTSLIQEEEVTVGSLVTVNLPKKAKILKSLMPSWMIPVGDGSVFKGVPGPGDVGVHVIPEGDLAVRVQPESSSLELCGNRLSPTIVLVAVDTEPSKLSARDRTKLLMAFAAHLGLSNSTRLRLLSSATSRSLQLNLYRLASGPGDVAAMRRSSAGSFIAWRVGCGAIPSQQLELLQRMEKSAVTGELHRVIGYPVLHWLVGDDRTRLLMLRRRRRRKRLAAGGNSSVPESVVSAFGATSGSRLEDETAGSGQLPLYGEGSGLEPVSKPATKNPAGVITSRTSVSGSTRPKSASLTSPSPKERSSRIPAQSSTLDGNRSRDRTAGRNPLVGSLTPTLTPRLTATTTPLPTTTTKAVPTTTTQPVDSMPVKVRDLKVIRVVLGDKLSFYIPRSAFNDSEDGSENLRLEVFHHDGISPVTSVSTGSIWVLFDSARARLQVSPLDPKLVGDHKFVVCAFDRKDNKICGAQLISVEKEHSQLSTKFKVCRGEHFQRFLREEELLYLEKKLNTKNISLNLSGARANLDWIRFNSSGRIFFGLPPPEWPLGISTFELTAYNKLTGERTVIGFGADVQAARVAGRTHRFQMRIQVPPGTKKASLPFEFASKIAYATDLSIDKVMVLQVRLSDEYSKRKRRTSARIATVAWTDRRQFSLTNCYVDKIEQLVNRMVDLEIATGTLIYQKAFRNRMRPFVLLMPMEAVGAGICEMHTSFLPKSPTTTTTTTTSTVKPSTTSNRMPLTTTPPAPTIPSIPPGSSITSLTVFTGLAFRSRLKLNKKEMDPKHFFVIFSSEQETVSRGSWIQLDHKDLSLYGLPLKSNEGFSTYRLTILRARSSEILTILPLNVSVVPDDREHLVNNLVRMQLRKLNRDGSTTNFHKSVLIAVEFRLKLVLALGHHLEGSTCRGSSCRKNIAVRQMSVDAEGNLVFEWAWRALYESAECNQAKLNKLNTRLLAWDGSARVVLRDLQLRLKQENLIATSVNVMPQGSCRGQEDLNRPDRESTPATQLTFFFTQAPVLNRGYRDKEHTFLVTAVIPACALLILVLVVALIVACCLHHKRKMHVRRRRGIDKPKRAVIFEEEMDEHPNHASKPLILPNEKPPLPPPDYVTEVMPTPVSHEEHIPLTTTSPYRHATNGGSTFRPDHPPMINT